MLQVDLAQKKGATGVILYSDPADVAQRGTNSTYPGNWWMPGMAVQLGSLYKGHGDPLTPFYPSIGKCSDSMHFLSSLLILI